MSQRLQNSFYVKHEKQKFIRNAIAGVKNRANLTEIDIYVVQKDTNVVLMSKFYSALMSALHVLDLIGPSSGAFCTSCIRRFWYVVLLCVLLDTSSRCNGWTCRVVQDDTRTLLCQLTEFVSC